MRYRDPSNPAAAGLVDDLLGRWRQLGRRGVLVGPKGHGKTTLLEQLERRLGADGYEIRRLRLRVESPTPDLSTRQRLTRDLGDRVVVSVDGLELPSAWTWWRLRRAWRRAGNHFGGVLATSHRPGRLPTLHEHRTTPELLRQLVGELLDDEDYRRVESGLDELFARHGGNVRECLRELYDVFGAGSRNPP